MSRVITYLFDLLNINIIDLVMQFMKGKEIKFIGNIFFKKNKRSKIQFETLDLGSKLREI